MCQDSLNNSAKQFTVTLSLDVLTLMAKNTQHTIGCESGADKNSITSCIN